MAPTLPDVQSRFCREQKHHVVERIGCFLPDDTLIFVADGPIGVELGPFRIRPVSSVKKARENDKGSKGKPLEWIICEVGGEGFDPLCVVF